MKLVSLTYNDFAHLDEVFPEAEKVYISSKWDWKLSDFDKDTIFIFHGGTDIGSGLYGEIRHPANQPTNVSRDAFEISIYAAAQTVGAFCYGICRGAQLLCVLNGGKLIQHLPEVYKDNHSMCNHRLDDRPFQVNSDHHQAMIPTKEAEVLGSLNNIPEIVWYPKTRSFCVQGHPEWLPIDNEFVQFCNSFIKEHL